MLTWRDLIEVEVTPDAAGVHAVKVWILDKNTGLSHERGTCDEEMERIESAMEQFDSGLITPLEFLSVAYNNGGIAQCYVITERRHGDRRKAQVTPPDGVKLSLWSRRKEDYDRRQHDR